MRGLAIQIGIALLTFAPLAFPASRPLKMKILVLAASGAEPSYGAILSVLDRVGTPYEAVVLGGKDGRLPALDDGVTGNFQGIILATGNLGICDPECRSALSAADWAKLDAYAAAYSVRTVSYYSFPEPRYGLQYRPLGSRFISLDEPQTLDFTEAATPLFPELRRDSGLAVSGAFVYAAEAVALAGESTKPIFKMGNTVAGVLHSKPDGREYLALTFDQSSNLRHSHLLHRGLLRWLTRGVHLGSSRVYLSAQTDDLFLPNSLFSVVNTGCAPDQMIPSPSASFTTNCPRYRITGSELAKVREWQAGWNSRPQTAAFRVAMAYNGLGSKSSVVEDGLAEEARRSAGDFFWISHTYSHRNLDCYAASDTGDCRPANFDESVEEIRANSKSADELGLLDDRLSIVTPGVSGIQNKEFLDGLAAQGVRYMVADMSHIEAIPTIPNTSIRSLNDKVILVPRRPTAIFFNAVSAAEGVAGSQTDEYNHYFGPDGLIRIGGSGGPPFFSQRQSYQQILERESEVILAGMLKFEIYPFMFHQSNLAAYDGKGSLLTDCLDLALSKFVLLSDSPVISLPQTEIGIAMEERLEWMTSAATATLYPGQSIVIASAKNIVVPLTGACAGDCSRYGGDVQSRVPVSGGSPVSIPLR
jgi:hypothetical protein